MDLPLWWDRDEFMKRFQHREIDSGNPVDANYAWPLTTAEAIAWNEESRERFTRDPRGGAPGVAEAMRQLEDILSKASRVVVESYEWESGLD
jgi:hypothetical protein